MLNPKAFGLTCGIFWAVSIVFITILAINYNAGATIILALGTLYKGLTISYQGALVGALWGFIDGFIAGWIFAWLYNKLLP